MANGERFNVIKRRTEAMRGLSDADRRVAIDAAPNVIGFNHFVGFTTQVRVNETANSDRIAIGGAGIGGVSPNA